MRAVLCLVTAFLIGCKKQDNTVTVYASQDQVYAEPILKDFTEKTGIRVRAVYDSEAVKTVGLVNRLIAEKSNPQCDVFWNNEELRTRQLEQKGIVERWVAVGFRTRRLVFNTNLASNVPKSMIELTNETWRGRVALAYPLFGTTATHFMVLRQVWGSEDWERWCRALQANTPILLDGNSVVVQLVGRGEATLGLTDSDDIAAGQRHGLPVRSLPYEQKSMKIRNTMAITSGAPHPKEAQRLFEYLQSQPVLKQLIAAHALEGPSIDPQEAHDIDWPRLLAEMDNATAFLRQVFLR